MKVAGSRGWTMVNLTANAYDAIAASVLKRSFPSEQRTFFELPSPDLLPLVVRTRTVPAIDQIARRDRDQWRMKDRRGATKSAPRRRLHATRSPACAARSISEPAGGETEAPPDAVWAEVTDLAVLAACLPGARLESVDGDGRARGHMGVRVGSMLANFEGIAEVVERGGLDPEAVVTPGIYVDTVVRIDAPAQTDPREDI